MKAIIEFDLVVFTMQLTSIIYGYFVCVSFWLGLKDKLILIVIFLFGQRLKLSQLENRNTFDDFSITWREALPSEFSNELRV